MVYIQAVKKRGLLRQIVEGAIVGKLKVREALLAFQTGIASPSFKQGRIILNTSGGGQSAGFEIGVQGKEFTQDNVFGLSEEFFGIYETAVASLTDDGDETNSRAILAAMFDDDILQTCNRRQLDATLIGE